MRQRHHRDRGTDGNDAGPTSPPTPFGNAIDPIEDAWGGRNQTRYSDA